MNTGLPDAAEEGAPGGAAFRAVAQSSRRAPAAIVVVALAVVAVALLTKQPAPVPSVPITDVTARLLPVAPVPPMPLPAAVPPSRNPTVSPHPTFVAIPARAGTTQIVPAGRTQVRLTISLPDGWQKASNAWFVKANGAAPAGLSIGAWQLHHVNAFPCRWSSPEVADGPFMGTVGGQAQVLSSWWGQDPGVPYGNSTIAPLAGERVSTTFLGYPAWYVEVLIPSYMDLSQCDGGQLVLWDTANGAVRYSLGPGELNRLYVVDVDGELIVIDAASFLETSKADLAELQAVVDSVDIHPWP